MRPLHGCTRQLGRNSRHLPLFLRNEQVSSQDVLAAHDQSTLARICGHAVVLCLQDTTELNINGQGTTRLGPLSYEVQRGLYLHPTYVVTTHTGRWA